MCPFPIPTVPQLRTINRDNVVSALRSSPAAAGRLVGPTIPNSITRVLSDSNAGLSGLEFLNLGWLALQLFPDTCEGPFLDRFASYWLKNYGGGRKKASLARGSILATGIPGTLVPIYSLLDGGIGITFQTTAQATIAAGGTLIPIAAVQGGAAGNIDAGTVIGWSPAISGVDGTVTVQSDTNLDGLSGGADAESDSSLRGRLLLRIGAVPMGGDATDWKMWALAVPGCTRAWVSPCGMGPGTVVVRPMFDQLRSSNGGFPLQADCDAVQAYLDTKKPVTSIDCFVTPPVPEPINFTLSNLNSKDAGTLANITTSVTAMLASYAAPASNTNGINIPATTIYANQVSAAVTQALGVNYFDLGFVDHPPPVSSSLAVLGSVLLQ